MKTFKFLFLSLALVGLSVSSQSCKEEEPDPTCTDGIMNGEEEGVDCGGPCAACPVGLQDTKWQSSGTNVAPLLVTLFNTDSIYAEFNYDFTYTVEQYDNTGAKQTLTAPTPRLNRRWLASGRSRSTKPRLRRSLLRASSRSRTTP